MENFIFCVVNLVQHINLPTRKGSKIIYRIIINIPNKILYSNVLPFPSISDHDVLYIIAKIPTININPAINLLETWTISIFRNKLRYEAHFKRIKSAWIAYRKVRNESIILQKHFEFKENERYMESHSQYFKSRKYNFRWKRKSYQ